MLITIRKYAFLKSAKTHLRGSSFGDFIMGTVRVLVVDDDELTAADVKDKLEKLGRYFVCSTASTGRDAVEEAKFCGPDIVLMDIVLEGEMDGIEAAAEIQSKFNIPVIYLTAFSGEEKLSRAKITEPFAYLIKPFNERELHACMEMAIYRHKAEAERKSLIKELQEALSQIRVLRGCLPICASCKKIRDDRGYWMQIEKYLAENADVDFTRAVCPECSKKFADN